MFQKTKYKPIFFFSKQFRVKNVLYKHSPMTGFEPQTSGHGSVHSANWATTTAQDGPFL